MKKLFNAKKSEIHSNLSLFLSCSVSLILISIFILLDSDKFSFGNTKKGSERGMLIGDIPEENPIIARRNFDCYEFEKDATLKQLALSKDKIDQLEKVLVDSDLPIPSDVVEYLKRRAACGYVSTKIEFTFKVSGEGDVSEYNKFVRGFLDLKKALEEISKDFDLEVILEEA